jgi:hypothetical protein
MVIFSKINRDNRVLATEKKVNTNIQKNMINTEVLYKWKKKRGKESLLSVQEL